MRDPHRLNNFYNELRAIHKTYVPDWRFGQMMSNIFHEDIFYMEEDEILKRIKKYFGEE